MTGPFHHDVQSERPDFPIALDRVGLEDVRKRIDIKQKNGQYSMDVSIKAFVNLPAVQRGAHMSRSAESIEDCISEQIFTAKHNIEEFAADIARAMLEKHAYAERSHVEMEGPFIIQARQRDGQASTQAAYRLRCTADATRVTTGEIDGITGGTTAPASLTKYPCTLVVSVTADGMIACPCGQEMSREFAKEMLATRRDLQLDPVSLDTILNVIPIATHNQRATGTITLQVPAPGAVDLYDVIDAIESSMSGRISGILKRPDEASLIRTVHQDPMFTEDVVRRMAWTLAGDRFKHLPDDMATTLLLVSMESIHPHQVSASLSTTLGQLRAKVKAEAEGSASVKEEADAARKEQSSTR
ncbi:MAG: GTP cyclohydrolase I FolE2 [Candidatus Lokiarchaeota archaeon]|nr:GTP cyclohydrolase I FolE2 [Candidatus Lokiarchaeota archaeon]